MTFDDILELLPIQLENKINNEIKEDGIKKIIDEYLPKYKVENDKILWDYKENTKKLKKFIPIILKNMGSTTQEFKYENRHYYDMSFNTHKSTEKYVYIDFELYWVDCLYGIWFSDVRVNKKDFLELCKNTDDQRSFLRKKLKPCLNKIFQYHFNKDVIITQTQKDLYDDFVLHFSNTNEYDDDEKYMNDFEEIFMKK